MRERQHGFILCFVQLKWEEVQTEARFVHLAGAGRGRGLMMKVQNI